MVSWAHSIAQQGKYVAIVSTVIETSDPQKEIAPAVALLGKVLYQFDQISDFYEPQHDGAKDQVFVTSSYTPMSHFEEECNEVLRMWEKIMGAPLDLTYVPDEEDDM